MEVLYRHRQVLRLLWLATLITVVVIAVLLLIRTALGWPGLLVLLVLAVVLGFVSRILARRVPERTVLEIDFEQGIVEQRSRDGAKALSGRKMAVVRDVVDALKRAADDPRVTGLFARLGPAGLGIAQAQEVRDAVVAFRARGKKTIAWCQTLGESQNGTIEYYLASAFEEIHLQPAGDMNFTGLLLNQPLLRPLLEKLGVKAQMDHRERYKTAKYMYTEDHLVEPHRESLETVLGDTAEQILEGIAQGRGISVEEARRLMDVGSFQPEEALSAKLVDALSYREDLVDRIKEKESGKLLFLDRYLARAGRPKRSSKGKSRIAIIHGTGMITRGRSRMRHFPPGAVMGSDDMADAFREAMGDARVKAIVFRINSPGGSATASEAIWRMVRRAVEAGKPVVASMSNVAGSGGYYIAAGASRILAQPGTITGSIGVVSGKMVTREAWRKLGINWEGVSVGANADLWSTNHEFSEIGWQRVQRMLDHIYTVFKQRVAEGRGLSAEQVNELAQGRIWTGTQAKASGLVDEIGGIHRAIEIARALAKIPADEPAKVVLLPRTRIVPEPLAKRESSDAVAMREMIGEVMEYLEPAAHAAGEWRAMRDGPLRILGIDPRWAR